jgi:hypothetical protein
VQLVLLAGLDVRLPSGDGSAVARNGEAHAREIEALISDERNRATRYWSFGNFTVHQTLGVLFNQADNEIDLENWARAAHADAERGTASRSRPRHARRLTSRTRACIGTRIPSSLKARRRAMEKIAADYGGEPSHERNCITDVPS